METVKSPCINICKLENNICVGCFRTIEEITHWTNYTDLEKKMVIELTTIRHQQNFKGNMGESEESFLKEASTEEKFMWWPQRCRLTDKLMWLTFAVRGQRSVMGPGGIRTEHRYYSSEEFIMMRLKDGC
jgi:predicted Fe-S protein YdhL (DUF1289 family)